MYFNTTSQWLQTWEKSTNLLVARNISLTEEGWKQRITQYTRQQLISQTAIMEVFCYYCAKIIEVL